MLEKAVELANRAYYGKLDTEGKPMIEHATRVMNRMDTESEKTVGILHDIVEDTPTTLKDLIAAGFPREVIEAVEILTRKNDMTYFDYIEDIATNRIATKVKLAELEDNKDISRVRKLSFQTFSLDERYRRAKKILENATF